MPAPLVPMLMAMVVLGVSTTLFLREYAPPPPPAPPLPPEPPFPPLPVFTPALPGAPAPPLRPPPPPPITSILLLVLFQSEGTVQLVPEDRTMVLGVTTTQVWLVKLPLSVPVLLQVRVCATEVQV